MISDVCPECESDHMDIQALTYKKVPTAVSHQSIHARKSALGLQALMQHAQSATCVTGIQSLHGKQTARPSPSLLLMKRFACLTIPS